MFETGTREKYTLIYYVRIYYAQGPVVSGEGRWVGIGTSLANLNTDVARPSYVGRGWLLEYAFSKQSDFHVFTVVIVKF